ncbi:MAG: hypothetical protein M1538_01410 [Candidatus Marsarchaeota archaeon]|jgi:hypothetical protein|nr:hypothetical protein [Candidatus Marsarchaeota archaeon]
MAELWDNDVDEILSDVDESIYAKYKIHVKDLLNNPYKFSNVNNISKVIELIKADIDDYINGFTDLMLKEKKELNDIELRADALTKQISQFISLNSKQNNVPVITPVIYIPEPTKTELIYIENIDTNISTFLQTIIPKAVFIVNTSTKYENYNFGDWTIVMQNGKNYNIKIFINQNMLIKILRSKENIGNLFAGAKMVINEIIAGSSKPTTPQSITDTTTGAPTKKNSK